MRYMRELQNGLRGGRVRIDARRSTVDGADLSTSEGRPTGPPPTSGRGFVGLRLGRLAHDRLGDGLDDRLTPAEQRPHGVCGLAAAMSAGAMSAGSPTRAVEAVGAHQERHNHIVCITRLLRHVNSTIGASTDRGLRGPLASGSSNPGTADCRRPLLSA